MQNNFKKIPYSPLVPLIESHVAIYKIYVLKNPLKENEIFYVGQTQKSLNERLSQHISQTGSNREKINYIKEITDCGEKPIIEAVETIKGTCFIDKMMVNEREYYWIKYYMTIGCKLLNSSGTHASAKCNEYHGYLSSLKRGETSWHYYYCGKTAGGYEVYDEEKLNIDGFNFPKPPPKIEEQENETGNGYNPFQNRRFLLKFGVTKESDKKKTEITTEIFPPQPAWSKEFLAGISFNSILEDIEEDGCDFEVDSDFEPEESDNDDDSEKSWQPETQDADSKKATHIIDIYLKMLPEIIQKLNQ